MQIRWVAPVALCLALGFVSASRADDQAEARKIIDKGITALGGEAKLGKFKALTWKAKGTVQIEGNAVPYTGEFIIQAPNQSKFIIEGEVGGNAFKVFIVVNGDKGWVKINDMLMEMDKDKLAEEKEHLHAGLVESLIPLKDKAFELSPVGEVKIGSSDAVGVKVSHKGHRDVSLFFDKKSGLLLKSETRAKDDSGKEFTQENLYSHYKEFDGVKRPVKLLINRDGKEYVTAEVTEYKAMEKLDGSEFAKP